MHDLDQHGLVDALLEVAERRGDGRAPIPDELLPPDDPGDEKSARYAVRLRPQPIKTFTERLRLTGQVDRLPRAFVRCTGYEGSVMGPFAERARSEGWLYRELETQHDLQLTDPDGTVELLDELAAASLT